MLTRRHFLFGSALSGVTVSLSCNQNQGMNEKDLKAALSKLKRPYLRMEMSKGDPGSEPVTKISGSPWWPANTERPTCIDGHPMSFIAQIRLDQVPGFKQPPALLSFHYCDQCTFDGKMPWGWEDQGHQKRYNCSIFSDLDGPTDDLGIVTVSSVEAQTPTFHEGKEMLGIEDIWKQFPETGKPGGLSGLEDQFNDERSKVGGWPAWMQNPLRPEDEMGEEMKFVAQLDFYTCPNSAWASGCAYLFVSEYHEDEQEAELVIQTS